MLKTTRRRWMAFGLGGAALLSAGSLLRWVAGGYALPAEVRSLALSVKERVIVRALVEALLPAEGSWPAGLALGVDQRIDEEVWAQPAATGDDLKAALQLLEHAPPLVGTFGRFSALEPAARLDVLAALAASDTDVVVQAVVSFKQLAHLAYYGHPQVWPLLGYDGPWQPVEKPPASSVRYAQLLAQSGGPA